MKKMNLVKKCSLALISIMLTAFLAACSNGGSSSSSDSGSGGGGGGSGSTGIKEGKAPATELFAESEVSTDWNSALVLSAGSWDYLAVTEGTAYTRVLKTTFIVTDPDDGELDCSSAKEIRIISLTDQEINNLKGADAEEELAHIKSSNGCGSFAQDKAYMDTKSKVLVLEQAITPSIGNVGKGKPLPVAYPAADQIKADSTSNQTKYKLYFGSDTCYYFAKK